MWTSSNHPGGNGRRYRYRDRALYRLSCWWHQPSKNVPEGTAGTATGLSHWKGDPTGYGAATMMWWLNYDGQRWRFTIMSFGDTRADEQTIRMVPDSVARTRNLRWWWECPDCGRRCGTLFLIPAARRFTCRACGGVTYTSRQKISRGQMIRRLGIAWPKWSRWPVG